MARLRFEETFNGKKVTPLVVPVFPAGNFRAVALPGPRDAARWRTNAAEKMT